MSELSFGEVGEILHLLQEIEAAEVDLEWGELRIQVRKHGTSSQMTAVPQPQPPPPTTAGASDTVAQSQPDASSTAQAAAEASADPSVASDDVASDWVAVSAPMAGTFYRSPSPEAPAFADVGDTVAAGDTVALIEVMKLFTELKADVAGRVARIDTVDGSMVEFGQALVWIEPA